MAEPVKWDIAKALEDEAFRLRTQSMYESFKCGFATKISTIANAHYEVFWQTRNPSERLVGALANRRTSIAEFISLTGGREAAWRSRDGTEGFQRELVLRLDGQEISLRFLVEVDQAGPRLSRWDDDHELTQAFLQDFPFVARLLETAFTTQCPDFFVAESALGAEAASKIERIVSEALEAKSDPGLARDFAP